MKVLRRSIALAAGLLAFVACSDTVRQPLSPEGHGPNFTFTSSTVVVPDTISVGQSAQCVAYFYDQNNNLVSPVTPTWGTTTSTLISVNASGVATGLAVGSAVVQASYGGVTGNK